MLLMYWLTLILTLAAKVEELQNGRGDSSTGADGSEAASQVADARMTLILDLSSKVTEQESEIMRLRDQLEKYVLSADAAGTSTVHSVVAESSSKCLDTGWRQRLCSPAQQNSAGTDSGVLAESSDTSRFGRQRNPATSKAVLRENDFSLGRTSQGSDQSYFKNSSSKQEKNATSRYKAHWASSCFDVDDLTDGDASVEDSKTGISDDTQVVESERLIKPTDPSCSRKPPACK